MSSSSYWSNAEVLRQALLRIIAYLLGAFIVWLFIVPMVFDTVILGPCDAAFPTYRLMDQLSGGDATATSGGAFPIRLVNIRLGTQFFVHLNTAFALSVLTALPFILIEVWHFVSPALYDSEAQALRFSLAWLPVLFYTGVLVGYYVVFPLSLRFLIFYDLSDFIENKLSLESYMSNFFTLTGAMGVVFLLPLFVKLLAGLGIINKETLKSARHYAIVLLMILAAVITPSGDPVTMLVVFAPLYLLYEVSISFVSIKPISKHTTAQ